MVVTESGSIWDFFNNEEMLRIRTVSFKHLWKGAFSINSPKECFHKSIKNVSNGIAPEMIG